MEQYSLGQARVINAKRHNKVGVSLLALEYTYMTSSLCQQIFLKNINYLQGFQLILSRFNNLDLITSIIPKYRRAVAAADHYYFSFFSLKKTKKATPDFFFYFIHCEQEI